MTSSVINEEIITFSIKQIDNFNCTSLGSILRNSLRIDTKQLFFKS